MYAVWRLREARHEQRASLPLPAVSSFLLPTVHIGEFLMDTCGLEEAQAGIKIAGRNINNLRYADDTTLMAESEEELKSLLMKVKEESKKLA